MSEGKHEKKRLSNELKQSAEKIKRKVQHNAGERAAAARSRSPREIQARRRKVGFIVGTVFAVFLLTMAFFAIIFSIYINKTMKNKVEVDLSAYDMSLATEMYAKNAETDEWEIYQTLYDGENRILLTGDQIPQALRDATVAIEDKRFYKHKGVDWRGTIRAVFSTVTGRGVQGGSTITQQLIKNVTGNDETTIKRKVTEIYRALQLEKRYDKDEILTCYLNTVYFGESCYGAQTASRMYFGKDAKDLTLAECASLIAITNNPSRYDPLISEWTLANNRSRQLQVLQNMYDQGIIKEKEVYEAACNEQVTFTNGYTHTGVAVGKGHLLVAGRLVDLLLLDNPLVVHILQHLQLPRAVVGQRPFADKGVIEGGVVGDADKAGALGQCQLRDVLAEIRLARPSGRRSTFSPK